MSASSYVHIEVDEIKRETDDAFLCIIGVDQLWIPKSQIADAKDYAEGDEDVELSISEWFARKEGLSDE